MVLTRKNIPELVEGVDPSTFRVHAPTAVIFLCGGPFDATSTFPKSLRDAFMRIDAEKPAAHYKVRLAEELNIFFLTRGAYKDILTFEQDIAQISELILLFSESFGSAAELGAFAITDEIAKRLLVVMDDKNYKDNSFVRLGPILALENQYGESVVCVLNRTEINIKDISKTETLDMRVFGERVKNAVRARLLSIHERTTFDPEREGHIIKLIVGLIQHYGALTSDEIEVLLYCLGVKFNGNRI